VSPHAFRVALTFDAEHPDRPSEADTTGWLIGALDRVAVRATFFVQGRWAEANPSLAREIATAGHLIGNHSHYHARMPLLTDRGLAEDVAESGRVIEDVAGVDPRPWFRCPFGAGAADPRVQRAIELAGYRHVGWHIQAGDWEPGRPGSLVEQDLVEGAIRHGDGAVILLHTWTDGMRAAMEPTIDRLHAAGAVFVTIDELDEIPMNPSWA
jgi:peptidoglycan-N-acetylglucosamine deacetylase